VTPAAPHVSVVIPTHNRNRMLAMTLRSVLWQRDTDLEVIVVDDGSTEDTAGTVRSLDDPRIRVLRHDAPRGVSTARNRGIDEARGAWIAFLDDDDLWAPDKLALQQGAAAEVRATWVYAGAVKIDARERITGGRFPPLPSEVMNGLPRRSLIPGGCSGVIVAREALSQTGGFDQRLVNLADWDLWIRLARTGSPAFVEEPLVGYRLHQGQSSLDVDLILKEAKLLESKHHVRLDHGVLHHYLAYKCLRAGRRGDAWRHFALATVTGEARSVTAEALRSLTRRRLRTRRPSVDSAHPESVWRERASGWLSELSDRHDPRTQEPPRSSSSSAHPSQDG
jgi:glycosyltransferase involved in cell wall biosynthesis